MKKILFLAILLMCWGCTNSSLDDSADEASLNITIEEDDIYVSQCHDQMSTKAGGTLDDIPYVALMYSDEGLVITQCNILMNCYVKQQKPEVKYSLEGDVIRYDVNDHPYANCLCFIEKMQSKIRHKLTMGKEYSLVMNGQEMGKFTWSEDLFKIIEL